MHGCFVHFDLLVGEVEKDVSLVDADWSENARTRLCWPFFFVWNFIKLIDMGGPSGVGTYKGRQTLLGKSIFDLHSRVSHPFLEQCFAKR